uniref:DNA mismatch repair proteins mutS family domain-containing protein n=1 Tax=Ananas comosus var. bracteatus TaxID=296719 RepID=A0A6V7QMK0_ANACO|nr:unnamed protein product [Ananas comosus var. bracteatus]
MSPLTALALTFTPKPYTSLFLRPPLSPSPSSSSSSSSTTTIALLFPLPPPPRAAVLRALRLRLGDRSPVSSAAAAASVVSDSLRILEWNKVCDVVSAFAGTALGREATREKLWDVDLSYEESKKLLEETAAAVELIKYGAGGMEFAGLDTIMVKSAIDRVSRGFPLDGKEAMAVLCLIQFAETLQVSVKIALKEDEEWYDRFMPLTELILDIVISRTFIKSVQQVIDEDGSVKDSASSDLKRYREQVRVLERKLYQLMDKLVKNDSSEAVSPQACIVNGRFCIEVVPDKMANFNGLLLSSSGVGSVMEPIAAIPLNDELQRARALVATAEEEVLSKLSDKMVAELDDIRNLLHTIIQLDVVTARAKYGIAYNGTFPDLYMPRDNDELPKRDFYPGKTFGITPFTHLPQRSWKLYMPKAHHPLLLHRHHENLHHARKEVGNATAEIRRRNMHGKNMAAEDETKLHLESMILRVSQLEKNHPIPVDFMISEKTNVLVITGPNTGGKTISLKTVGLASLMAKTGLYVLASEPVKIPWFDAIFADIGDEQSLSQSLSTFSGHLKQIGAIRSLSTSKSLVLLDEVGAGTNPLEGAALGMSLLESFAKSGSFLTIVTTHHGELKTLKYRNSVFENACVEFDEESLRPTFKILWGIPGRSNAINIAERLGLPHTVIDGARKLHGIASAEINGVILDMERFKQDFQQHLQQAQHFLMLSKKLHENLFVAKQRISDHVVLQRSRKTKAILDNAAIARSLLRSKMQQFRERAIAEKPSGSGRAESVEKSIENLNQQPPTSDPTERIRQIGKQTKVPEVGDVVYVSSLGKQASVLKVEASKGLVLLQAGNMKLKLKFGDIVTQHLRTSKQ